MPNPVDTAPDYFDLLNLATDVGHAEYKFWRSIIAAFDADRVDINTVRELMRSSSMTSPLPSRATAYRRLDTWREIVEDLNNPGRGA